MSTTSINNLQEAKTQLMDWSTQVNKQTLDPNKIQKITYVFFLSIPLETPITHTYQTVESLLQNLSRKIVHNFNRIKN